VFIGARVGEAWECEFDAAAFTNLTDAMQAAVLPPTRPTSYAYFA